jgi:hypothetical protein
MKFAILVLTIIGSVSAFADTPCQKKQIEAAKKAMAKDYGVMKKYIMYSGFEPGFWTELVGENIGSDEVTVALERDGADTAIEKYRVSAKQIGTSSDCKILKTQRL